MVSKTWFYSKYDLNSFYFVITDGGYTQWTQYSPCTAICIGDIGERVRRRFCENPQPQFNGLTCLGNLPLYNFLLINWLLIFISEQGLGPNREGIECEGTVPKQREDASKVCFDL